MKSFKLALAALLITAALFSGCKETKEDAALNTSAAPEVSSVSPANGSASVAIDADIELTFSEAMSATSLSAAGANCDGAVQLSSDDFTSCVALGDASADTTGQVFTLAPSSSLSYATTYKVKITTDAQSSAGVALANAYTQADGFITTSAPTGTTDTTTDSTTDSTSDTTTVADPTLSVTAPTLNRSHYVDDETGPRTYSFTYSSGDTVTCSRDGGNTYSSCDSAASGSGTLIWALADKNNAHYIKVTNSVGTSTSSSFTPSTDYASVTFHSCTETVSANEDFDAFDARISAADQVICLNDGVTVTRGSGNTATYLTLDQTGMVIIAREGSTATFTNDNSSGGNDGIFWNATTAPKLVGLTLTSSLTTNFKGIYLTYASGAGDGLELLNSTLTCSGITSLSCISIQSGGSSATNPLTIKNSTIDASNLSSSGYPLYVSDVVSISNSTINSGYLVAYVFGSAAELSISNSTITSTKDTTATSSGVFTSFNDFPVLSLTNNQITTHGMPAIVVNGTPSTTVMTLNGNTFKRGTTANADTVALFGHSGVQLDSSTANTFCNVNQGLTNANWNYILDTTNGTPTGSFSLSNQVPSDTSANTPGGSFAACN